MSHSHTRFISTAQKLPPFNTHKCFAPNCIDWITSNVATNIMCSASNPISHHTSHTLANGASSSNKGAQGHGKDSHENGGKRYYCGQVVSSLFFIRIRQ